MALVMSSESYLYDCMRLYKISIHDVETSLHLSHTN